MPNLKINMNSLEDVEKSLKSRTLRVCIIGIGRIGLLLPFPLQNLAYKPLVLILMKT